MRYMGGKSRISKPIAEIISSFSGGGAHSQVYFAALAPLKAK